MRILQIFASVLLINAATLAGQAQNSESKDGQTTEAKGLPPRAAATDYQSHAQAGKVTIAAEFMGHSVPRPEGPLTTEEYVVVEVGFFGDPGQHVELSMGDFSLRINGKKAPLPRQPFGYVVASLRDPSWSPPEADTAKKSKGGLSTGGGGQSEPSTPAIVHIPIEMQRAMAKYVQETSLRDGNRPLPEAGLIFFPYRGNPQKIRSLELMYSGSAGNATIPLEP